jgi:hypothetical protein
LADLRIIPAAPARTPTTVPSQAKADAARAAQRAFFQTALNQAQGGSAVNPLRGAAAVAAPPRAAAPPSASAIGASTASSGASSGPASGSGRPPRPGSILDIKV